MTKTPNDFEQIRSLVDLASEESLALSDDEVRNRASLEGVSIEANAVAFRDVIDSHMTALRLAKLRSARVAMEAQSKYVADAGGDHLSFEEMLERLAKIVASGLVARDSQFLLAFRSGKDIDEQDLRTLLEDYDALQESGKNREGGDTSE